MRCNSESIFFSGTGHSSHCPELTPLWLSAESAALLVFPWEQELLSTQLPLLRSHPWGLLGSWFSCAPSLGPRRALLPFAGPAVAWGDNISDPVFAPWVTVAGTPGFTPLNKTSRASKLWDGISHFLFSPHKIINERISAVNSLGCFIIYFHFFTIHLSITWNFHWNQQDLQYLFFLLGNTVYSDHPILLPLPGDLAEWMLMK